MPWTRPAELAFGPECTLPPLGGRFANNFIVGLGDASVMWMDYKTTEEKMRAAITRNGDENIPLWEP